MYLRRRRLDQIVPFLPRFAPSDLKMNSFVVLCLAVVAGFASASRNEANVNIYLHLADDEDPNYANTMHYAHCEMEPNRFMPGNLHHKVHGGIQMHQRGDGPLTMEFHLTGFNVSEDFADHNHGLQIHEYGDMEHGCDTIGELYHNEHAPDHADPGDLGDLHDDAHGEVNATRTFDWLTIGHNDGILGRSMAILQGDHTSHTAIIACCVIGRSHAH